MPLVFEGAVTQLAEAIEEDGAGQRIARFALVEFTGSSSALDFAHTVRGADAAIGQPRPDVIVDPKDEPRLSEDPLRSPQQHVGWSCCSRDATSSKGHQ